MYIITSTHPDDHWSVVKKVKTLDEAIQAILEEICTDFDENGDQLVFSTKVEWYDKTRKEVEEYAKNIEVKGKYVKAYRFDDQAWTIIKYPNGQLKREGHYKEDKKLKENYILNPYSGRYVLVVPIAEEGVTKS